MTKNQPGRMHLPILFGLVLLFLSDNFSDFSGSSFSKNQLYPIETLDFRPDSIETSQIRKLFSTSKLGKGKFKSWNYNNTTFQRLSRNRSRLTQVLYKSQSIYFQSFVKKLTLSLLHLNPPSDSTEDPAFPNS